MSTTQTRTRAAVRAEHAVKVYGTGDTAVTALDDVTVEFPADWLATVIDQTGLADRLRHRPAELSGGH